MRKLIAVRPRNYYRLHRQAKRGLGRLPTTISSSLSTYFNHTSQIQSLPLLTLAPLSLLTGSPARHQPRSQSPNRSPWVRERLPSAGLMSVLDIWSDVNLLKYLLLSFGASFCSPKYARLSSPQSQVYRDLKLTTQQLQSQLLPYFETEQHRKFTGSNLWSAVASSQVLRKKLVRMTTHRALGPMVSCWYHETLIRFLENATGRRIALNVGPFVQDGLTLDDRAFCSL